MESILTHNKKHRVCLANYNNQIEGDNYPYIEVLRYHVAMVRYQEIAFNSYELKACNKELSELMREFSKSMSLKDVGII